MPRGDRTGPAGQGRMTGRGMGFCAGYDVPGYENWGFGPGRGFRGGYGRGMGRGRMPVYSDQTSAQSSSADIEKERVKMETESLKQQLDYLAKKVEELEEKK
ncbi:MAG: DUF5320 domain-containing protein [bacterium]